MRALKIVGSLVDAMVDHCRGALPEEACGLLGGRGDVAWSHYPLRNIASRREERFLGDPGEQMDAFRRMEAAGESLVAIYHSHPRTPPVPSRADLEEAAYPDAYMVIVGFGRGDRALVRAFRVHPGRLAAAEVHWHRVREKIRD